MKRRAFTTTTLGALGLSALPAAGVMAATADTGLQCHLGQAVRSQCGLKLQLEDQQLATQDADQKQFILTFKTTAANLSERIYHLRDRFGRSHAVYMTPLSGNRLQAVFNWRTRA